MKALPFFLNSDHIVLGGEFSSKRDVIRAIGNIMLAGGDVTPRYVEGMFRKEELFNTCITEGIALPHGTNDVKNEVIRESIVVVQVPQGLDWGEGKTVFLAIGFAGTGHDSHVRLMTSIAGVLQDKHLVATLMTAREKEQIVRIWKQNYEPS